ncbi:isoprenylcysteine carboxylmethyltransferase family protein [Aureisphaera sp. CAU 1614]|uniref:Isoprenylcysteine carboxylmethyltransferase family protein n=1 Tax=Halomarinibacterium sedimenti TaxID=2857106 RepID=A0A9X1K010_9FLAO|nr:isoprenylcysteine carboxylmethyltransferase family protein [Halomarinibacterium sedimenti]MBW2939017.1 isoprenylcysteine carboxylmethyltransferase family protein [Halomarinibacterium sedimenti]
MALREELKTQGDFLFRYRSFLPLIILVVGLAVFAYFKLNPDAYCDFLYTETYKYICLGVSLLGFFIRVFTIGYAAENTSGRNTHEGQIADEINTTGIYSIVRHPLYLGNFFMWLGIAMLTASFWFLVAFVLFYYSYYYLRICFAEEAFLRTKFEDAYVKYSEKVPPFFPSFKNYKASNRSFNLRKVIRQEKNGIAAIFLLFWFFEMVGDFIVNKEFVFNMDFWFYAGIIASVVYLILKVLKKRKLI